MDFSLIGISGTQFAQLLAQACVNVAPYVASIILCGKLGRLSINAITGKGLHL